MKGWIEVTDLTSKQPYMVNLIHIEYIDEHGILHLRDGELTVVETYAELKQKISETE